MLLAHFPRVRMHVGVLRNAKPASRSGVAAMSEPLEQKGIDSLVAETAAVLGRRVLGREPTPEEAAALNSIFGAAAQALAEGFIQRLADHVLAERREETIEEFFEDKVKAD